MKKFILWLMPAVIVSTALFTACGSSSDDNPDPSKGGIQGLLLRSDKKTVWDHTGDKFTLTAVGDDGVDYSTTATFYVNNEPITGRVFNPSGVSGAYEVYAKYNDVKSNVLSLSVLGESFVFSSIQLTSDESVVEINVGDSFTFKVVGTAGTAKHEITEVVKVYVDEVLIPGYSFVPTASKTYAVYATFGSSNQRSNVITIKGTDLPQKFKHRVLIEDYTGTWCQYCPRIIYAIEQIRKQTDRIAVAAIHNGDAMVCADGTALHSLMGVNSWPTAYINRKTLWNSLQHTTYLGQPTGLLQSYASYGIAISSTLTNSSGKINVSLSFAKTLTSAKYVVYVLEDDLVYEQTNAYTDLYPGTKVSMSHKDVLRKAATAVAGNSIPAASSTAGSTYEVELTPTFTATNAAKLSVLVAILDGSGNAVNARVVPANTTKDFERP